MKKKLYGIILLFLVVLIMPAGCGKTLTETVNITTTITELSPKPLTELELRLLEKLRADSDSESITAYPDTVENRILAEFLSKNKNENWYYIVSPDSVIGDMNEKKECVVSWFNGQGYDVSNLLDKLLEVNSDYHILEIPSCITEGYYINYDNKFGRYIGELSEGYEENTDHLRFLGKNFPHFIMHLLYLSIPAYDSETHYMLLYSSKIDGAESLETLYLMKYEDDILFDLSSKRISSGIINWGSP